MPIILGANTLIQNVIPTGVDAGYIYRFSMQRGMNPTDVLSMAAVVIGEANQYAAAQYGGLFYLTERLYATYAQGTGTRRMTPLASEFSQPPGSTNENIGHMMFIRMYADKTEWSRKRLQHAMPEDLRADVEMKKTAWYDRVDFDIFSALFRKSEIAVGTVGKSVPWVNGTDGSVDYLPPQWRSKVHAASHSHFIRITAALSSANAVSTIETMAEHLAHHGHTGNKLCYVGDNVADALLTSTDKKVANFINPDFIVLSGNAAAPVSYQPGQIEGVPGEIVCYVQTKNGLVEVRKHDRVPVLLPDGSTAAGHLWMGKTYGNQDMRNPLAIRVQPDMGFGLMMNPQVDKSVNPSLESILFEAEHGVNVNDRTNGVAAQIASGGATYEEPTDANLL